MDPFSALAVAATVVRFLDVGGKVFAGCWENCRELQNVYFEGYDEEQRQEERARINCELQERVSRLITLVSEAQLPSTECLASQPATPAQQQLINAASEWSNNRANIDQLAHRPVAKPNGEADPKARRPLALFSRFKSQEPSYVTREEIGKIENQCEVVRSQAMDSILLCLWENAKLTEHWEVQFGTQLNTAICLLENIEKQSIPSTLTSQTRPPKGDHSDLVAVALDDLNEDAGISIDRVKFRDAVLLLIEAGQSISLLELGKELTKALGTGIGITQVIRNELVEFLWKENWEMDMSIPGVSAT